MSAKESRENANLLAVWEAVPDPDAEQRLLQVYALLLTDLNNPQVTFDKGHRIAHDPDR